MSGKGSNFVHLRLQSSYSMLSSMIKIEDIKNLVNSSGMHSVALTDKSNLFGSLEFSLAIRKAGLQPIHGIIINLLYENNDDNPKFAEILLLAKNDIGYKNLLKLASIPYLENSRKYCEHITLENLINYSEGIIMLSGYTDGPIGKELNENNKDSAINLTLKFKDLFGDRFYFEIFRQGQQDELKIETDYLTIAKDLKIPLVATNKVLFPKKEDHDNHDVLLCISEGVTKEAQNRKYASPDSYFKSASEMEQLFKDLPSAIENSFYISIRCSAAAEEHQPMLPNFAKDISENDLLRSKSIEGLEKRLSAKFESDNLSSEEIKELSKPYFDRLNYELDIVTKMNFAGYFLIVSDFIKWSKSQGINVGPGRGSGAGSIIAWSLLITDLDPLRFKLLFERFLNPERISMPDFDIDFCQERREEVINYVRQKYGDNRVAQIITFGKLQAKAVIKDVSRVLSLRYEIADYLTELVPFNAVNPVTLGQAVSDVPELKDAHNGKGLYDYKKENELIKQVLDTSLALEGLHRHSSIHAAGIVISGDELLNILPLYKDQNGDMSIIQYSMKYAEAAGLVKFDFLGLQTLTVISKTLELLRLSDIYVDLSKISIKDAKTYEMLSKGDSVGVFQFESVGMKDTIRKLKPDRIEDLMALGALYRPGPMDNIPTYIACKHGKQKPDYLHPKLKDLLEETHGVIVYQEQVLEIAKILAGYSLGSADLLRRAMGKKIKAEMEAQEKMFVDGAEKNGISSSQAKEIFAAVAKFAGYGFNRAHAASYGVISYYTAYLKANYPVEFLVACLNLDISDYDKINLFKEEARALDIEFFSPDINKSSGFFTIKTEEGKKSIIYGLGAIRNVTVATGDEIAKSRKIDGNYKSATDFAERIFGKNLTKRSLESLIKAGALDSICNNRKTLLESVQKILSYSSRFQQDKITQQFSLFSLAKTEDNFLDEVEDFEPEEKAMLELDVLGLFSKYHYLDSYINKFIDFGISSISSLSKSVSFGSGKIKIAGVILKKDARMSPRGRFITLLLSDPSGNADITIYSEKVMKDFSNLLSNKTTVVVDCDSFRDEGGIRLTATSFTSFDEFIQSGFQNINLKISKEEDLEKIIEFIGSRQDKSQESSVIYIDFKFKNYISKIKFSSNHKFSIKDMDYLSKFF
jgi:DNA polymerase III subunit alpha